MRKALKHRRQQGQTIVMAAVAMVALVGALAMVVDAGMFFVIQRQLQSAADAGALAGAWHDPICPAGLPGCVSSPATPPLDPVTHSASCDGTTGFPACDLAVANGRTVSHLCGGTVHVTVSTGTKLIRPSNVNTIVVTAQCDATYSFGRILELTTKSVSASSAAALGNRVGTPGPPTDCKDGGDMTDLTNSPPCGYIARLIV